MTTRNNLSITSQANFFKSSLFPTVVFGAIIGYSICESVGILASVAGIIGGAIAGLFAGRLYGLFIILLLATFTIPWNFIRKSPNPMQMTIKEQNYLTRYSGIGMTIGISFSGIIWLTFSWTYGLLALLISSVVIALTAVIIAQIHCKNEI